MNLETRVLEQSLVLPMASKPLGTYVRAGEAAVAINGSWNLFQRCTASSQRLQPFEPP